MLKSVAGRQVPFAPRQFPIRLSRRVGLRTMGSIAGKALCKVDIVVQEDSTPNATHAVSINGIEYHNGDTAILEPGTYDLTWASGNGGIFSSWGVSGKVSVEDSGVEETTLTVTCGGTLTLNMIACPSGEQITNGRFETGDLTGWSYGEDTTVDTEFKHSGEYAVWLAGADISWIEQTLTEPLQVSCVESFTAWVGKSVDSYPYGRLTVLITYTDETTSTHEFNIYTVLGDFEQINIKPYLTAGKTIAKIRFSNTSEGSALYLDDASLIGKG